MRNGTNHLAIWDTNTGPERGAVVTNYSAPFSPTSTRKWVVGNSIPGGVWLGGGLIVVLRTYLKTCVPGQGWAAPRGSIVCNGRVVRVGGAGEERDRS